MVHSVDRRKLVAPLDKGAHERSHPVDVLLQVSLDPPGTDQRSGADPDELDALADAVDEAGMLRLRGLMAVAPLGEDPRSGVRPAGGDPGRFLESRPDADWLSAGMSADLEAAVAAGATHVRIGSAVLGSRPEVK